MVIFLLNIIDKLVNKSHSPCLMKNLHIMHVSGLNTGQHFQFYLNLPKILTRCQYISFKQTPTCSASWCYRQVTVNPYHHVVWKVEAHYKFEATLTYLKSRSTGVSQQTPAPEKPQRAKKLKIVPQNKLLLYLLSVQCTMRDFRDWSYFPLGLGKSHEGSISDMQ